MISKGGRIMKYDGFIYMIDWDCVFFIPIPKGHGDLIDEIRRESRK